MKTIGRREAIRTVAVVTDYAGRSKHVIGRAENSIGAGISRPGTADHRARIRAAIRGEVARAAGYSARRRQLFIPKECLAEKCLGCRDRISWRCKWWIKGWHW